MTSFGGNDVRSHNTDIPGEIVLCESSYFYSIVVLKNQQTDLKHLKSFTLFVLNIDEGAEIHGNLFDTALEKHMAVQYENAGENLQITVKNGSATLLVSGTRLESKLANRGVFVKKNADLYKVQKPWGHELWINGQHELYAFKEIFIRSGTKTSLQYHNFKKETNLLVNGDALLHFNASDSKSNEDVREADISTVKISALSSVDVSPPVLHRLEAVTDITLYETSTPHLDDVIRISDDSDRPDGRIELEHRP